MNLLLASTTTFCKGIGFTSCSTRKQRPKISILEKSLRKIKKVQGYEGSVGILICK